MTFIDAAQKTEYFERIENYIDKFKSLQEKDILA